MNLRQKAKHYKQRCEMLEKLTLPRRHSPLDYVRQPIVTLRSEQCLRSEEYRAMQTTDDLGLTMINKIMARDFIHELLNYANVVVEKDDKRDCIVIRATMKVIDIRNGGGVDG